MLKIIYTLTVFLCLGSGCLAQSNGGIGTGNIERNEKNARLMILSIPKAAYTEQARENNISGAVKLKIEFLKDERIGKITVIESLPYGLTEQAMIAAKRIKFLPEKKDGKNITVTKVLPFNFSLK